MLANTLVPPLLDVTHPLSIGLVFWWPMNEGGGRRILDVAQKEKAQGVMNNFSYTTASGRCGSPIGPGIAFDGVDDSISCGSGTRLINTLISTNFSISAWARVDNLAAYGIIAYKGTTGGIPNPLQIYWEPAYGGTYWFLIGNGSSSNGPSSNAGLIQAGIWHHLVCVRNGSTGYFYINGRLAGSGTNFGTAADGGQALTLGSRTGSYISQGAISQVRIYDRSIGEVEARQLYNDPFIGTMKPRSTKAYNVAIAFRRSFTGVRAGSRQAIR